MVDLKISTKTLLPCLNFCCDCKKLQAWDLQLDVKWSLDVLFGAFQSPRHYSCRKPLINFCYCFLTEYFKCTPTPRYKWLQYKLNCLLKSLSLYLDIQHRYYGANYTCKNVCFATPALWSNFCTCIMGRLSISLKDFLKN